MEGTITMKKRAIWITSAAAGTALVLSGAAVAFASTGGFAGDASDESDSAKALTGTVLDQASAAAIAAAGGGTVAEAEEGDDGTSAYEVEVRLDDGTSIDVTLDANFAVLGTSTDEGDSGEPAEEGPQGDGDGETADD